MLILMMRERLESYIKPGFLSSSNCNHLSMFLQPVKWEQEPSAKLHSVAVLEFYVTFWQPFINSSFSIKFMGGILTESSFLQ